MNAWAAAVNNLSRRQIQANVRLAAAFFVAASVGAVCAAAFAAMPQGDISHERLAAADSLCCSVVCQLL